MTEHSTRQPVAFRRVVTGHRNGRATFLSDGPAPTEHHYQHTPGMKTAVLWATDSVPAVDLLETMPAGSSYVPEPGQTKILAGIFPPDAVMAAPGFDIGAAVGEQISAMPGLAERFEPDNPGMHVTPSVDYAIVVRGQIVLDLGEGEELELGPGDVVIQQMTRHAWRVRGDEPAHLVFVLLGTDAVR